MIRSVKHVSIPVKDQNRAVEFYTKKLGFKVIVDVELSPGGQRWIVLEIPNGETKVVLFTPEGHEDRVGTFSNIIFTSEDVNKTHVELEELGVEFTEGPKEESWGTYALFKDPDGNTFCLSSS